MSNEIKAPNRRILVTGASGFIGRRLVEKLIMENDVQLTAVLRNAGKKQLLQDQNINTIIADLSNRAAIDQAVQGHDTVINLAYDFKRSQKSNMRAFNNLFDACIKHGVKRFIQISSIVVYDDWPGNDISEQSPTGEAGSDYKNTKMAIERALQLSSQQGELHAIVLQPTIVYGPFSWLWSDYIVEKLETGKVILPNQCDGACNAVYVDDVVDAIALAAKKSVRSLEKYIISGPQPVTWRGFYESYNAMVGKDSIEYMDIAEQPDEQPGLAAKIKTLLANPLSLAQWAPVRHLLNMIQSLLGDKAIEQLKNLVKKAKKSSGAIIYYPNQYELKLYAAEGICDISKARSELGYQPAVPFKTGIELTAQYVKDVRR